MTVKDGIYKSSSDATSFRPLCQDLEHHIHDFSLLIIIYATALLWYDKLETDRARVFDTLLRG